MPRNISFAMTTGQVRRREKTVTRRMGFQYLELGEILNACVKCQGLKPGDWTKGNSSTHEPRCANMETP